MNTTALDTVDNATDAEILRYQKAFRETRRVIDECITNLGVLEALETDADRKQQLALNRSKLENERSNLIRANIAFHAHQATMVPPSPAQVAEISDLSAQAVKLTVASATAAATLKLATSALNKFADIQDIAGA